MKNNRKLKLNSCVHKGICYALYDLVYVIYCVNSVCFLHVEMKKKDLDSGYAMFLW